MWAYTPVVKTQSAEVDLVVIPRERYAPTLKSLKQMLKVTPADVRIIVVRGGMPERMVRALRSLGGDRFSIVGPSRHLGPNAARSIGLDHARATYVVFIDNDVLCQRGWLEALVDMAKQKDAWVVRPIVLQSFDANVTVHEAGGLCRLEQRGDVVHLVETHLHMGQTMEEMGTLPSTQVEMFEFHAVLFHRERLIGLGGPDENMLAQAEHLDLALRVHQAGGTVWRASQSRVIYEIPNKISIRELPFFLGRWSPRWSDLSQDAFVAKFGIDPTLSRGTWGYPARHRTYAFRFVSRLIRPVAPASARRLLVKRLDNVSSRWIDRLFGRHLADASLRFAPGWRGGGVRGSD